MLRVINQELGQERAWTAFMAGDGKKDEPFSHYLRRKGMEARTAPDAEHAAARDARTIQDVKDRLGSLYKPPIRA